jgi:hypothetical protein
MGIFAASLSYIISSLFIFYYLTGKWMGTSFTLGFAAGITSLMN